MKCLSLFSNVGIGETYFDQEGIEVVVANELEKDRAKLYRELHPKTNMITGDINESEVYNKIISEASKESIELIVATPPCQGMSIAHAKRAKKNDPRNSLIKQVVRATKELKPKYVLIENVPGMVSEKTFIAKDESVIEVEQAAAAKLFESLKAQGVEEWKPDEKKPDLVLALDECTEEYFISQTVNKQTNIMPYIHLNLGDDYEVSYEVLDAADYDTPHYRKRLITLMSRKDCAKWEHPKPKLSKDDHITTEDAIGHLPTLEAGQGSDIKWHSMKHKSLNKHHITWMKHTPTGKSAFENKIYYPKTKDEGFQELRQSYNYMRTLTNAKREQLRKLRVSDRCGIETREIKGFASTYKRMDWDRPAPTVTMLNGFINSQNNVHPGRRRQDGLYSDARVLTVKEICAIIGLPNEWADHLEHDSSTENFLRKVLGECFPPMLAKSIVNNIPK